MGTYAEIVGCRWQFVLEYFGEPADRPCGHCDNDKRAEVDRDDSSPNHPFPRGSRVRHAAFGVGKVIGYAGPGILLDFDRVGYKRLDVQLVRHLREDPAFLHADSLAVHRSESGANVSTKWASTSLLFIPVWACSGSMLAMKICGSHYAVPLTS